MKIYIDGRYYEKEDAKISVFDHGLLYGDGVFEGIRAYSGLIFRFEEHLARLEYSARAIMLDLPISIDAIAKAVIETLKINQLH